MVDEKQTDYEYIDVEGSDIFFHCDVSNDSVVELCRAVRKIEREQASLGIDHPCVRVHIQSDGGGLYPGLAAMDFLKNTKAHVTTYVEGICASAATFILLGGDRRVILPNGYVLIHQLSDNFWGTFENLKDEMNQAKRLMRHLKKIYLRETSIPSEKLDKFFKRDIYLSARRCIKFGLGLPP
jgi:ATP-dependent protease ClpP protease subunit